MSERIIFRAVKGSLKDEEFVFKESGLCLIGRSSDSALRISKEKDMRISRRHCLLVLSPPRIRIRDLGSRNGTYVNGERLDAGTLGEDPAKISSVDRILKHGDEVALGETTFRVDIPSMRSEDEAKVKPPPGTKVIKLTKPTDVKAEKLIKSRPVDTGFFSASLAPSVPTSTSPMTEAIPRQPNDNPMERTVLSDGATTIQGKPIPLTAPKSSGVTLTLKAKSTVPPPPATPAPASPSGKPPIVLKGKKVDLPDGATSPKPLKAKIVGRKHSQSTSDASVSDNSAASDADELSGNSKLGERSGKRMAKFRVKNK